MSRVLYELPDRYVLDTGAVVGKHHRAMYRVLSGESLDGELLIDSDDLQRFAKDTGQRPSIWSEGEDEEPSKATFEWAIPQKYLDLNLEEHLIPAIEQHLGQNDDNDWVNEVAPKYVERFQQELELIRLRGMTRFFQCMIYLVDTFKKNGVVWGVGRGSSVESLILFLIGVHRIDPILYEIELEHFFRD